MKSVLKILGGFGAFVLFFILWYIHLWIVVIVGLVVLLIVGVRMIFSSDDAPADRDDEPTAEERVDRLFAEARNSIHSRPIESDVWAILERYDAKPRHREEYRRLREVLMDQRGDGALENAMLYLAEWLRAGSAPRAPYEAIGKIVVRVRRDLEHGAVPAEAARWVLEAAAARLEAGQ